jgi:hypothetical protein
MIDYGPLLQNLPIELQAVLLQLAKAVEENVRQHLASSQTEIIDVRALANGLVESQLASNERLKHVETILVQLAEAQNRTEARMEEFAQAQQQLAQAQTRTEARMEELAQAQTRTEARMEELAQAQQQTEQSLNKLAGEVSDLTKTMRTMQPRLARADGWLLERRYIERAPSFFGRWLRQVEVLWPGRLDRKLETKLNTELNPSEREEVLRLDAILRGKTPLTAEPAEIYVALEASVTVNISDVDRAAERAVLLRRLRLRVVSVVAGEIIERDAEEYALANAVAILYDSKRQGWEQALAAA